MSGMQAPSAAGDELGLRKVRHLLIASAVAILLTGCGLPAERNMQAYEVCLSRHPQEAALCEGPREAYEVGTATYQARATPMVLPAGGSDHPAPAPVQLRPNLMPVAPGPNG
jgi:hypothetical protein